MCYLDGSLASPRLQASLAWPCLLQVLDALGHLSACRVPSCPQAVGMGSLRLAGGAPRSVPESRCLLEKSLGLWVTPALSQTVVLLCPLSESPSRKREDLHDNVTHKGREICC